VQQQQQQQQQQQKASQKRVCAREIDAPAVQAACKTQQTV
jgi:hypothetical protein